MFSELTFLHLLYFWMSKKQKDKRKRQSLHIYEDIADPPHPHGE